MLGISSTAMAKEFTLADLQRIVGELEKVLPKNPAFRYPIKCELAKDPEVNASAGYEEDGKVKQAIMLVNTGLVDGVKGDERLLRACIAHELSHLSLGHALEVRAAARDLRVFWKRQQEYAADKSGADALVKTGHSRKDMVDLLMYLNSLRSRNGNWLSGLTQDHADAKARAAAVSENPAAYQALATYDSALAYEDARAHFYARSLFNIAATQWPALTEAYINAGKCSLLYYYDNLPGAVRTSWWRPDFGALITDPHAPLPQDTAVSAQDRKAWADAYAAINKAVDKNPGNLDALELQALAQVLEPDAAKDVVQKGIDWFNAHMKSGDDSIKLRYANNAGVGYQRLGDLTNAYKTIIDAQRASTRFNPAIGENMGLVVVRNRSKDDNVVAANVMFTWLSATPSISPRWNTVKKTFDSTCTAAGLTAKPITDAPIYLCSVVSLYTSGKGYGILLPLSIYRAGLGEPQKTTTFSPKYPGLTELKWHDGKVVAFTEGDQVMRITSFEPDAYMLMRPRDRTAQETYKVKVGMTKKELYDIVNEKSGVAKNLARGGDIEEWTYFPAFNMGVLFDGDTIKGITVSPIVQG